MDIQSLQKFRPLLSFGAEGKKWAKLLQTLDIHVERFFDGCSSLCVSEAQGMDCAEINLNSPGLPSGPFVIDPDGPGGQNPFTVYCDMERDGGGWTLVAVVADENDENWTLAGNLWSTSDVTFGGPSPYADARFSSITSAIAHERLRM